MGERLVARAPAKVNLFLHITGRRADGYHLLESLVAFTQVADTLEAEMAPELSLTVEGPFAGDAGGGGDNLVLKAARLLQQHTATQSGAALRLSKNIPVGGGLGGGSADAAAALKLLNQLWNLSLPDAQLLALAPQLGADVAMCLNGSSAIARGIGDELEPVSLPPMHAVLVHPRVPLLTKDVYGALATKTVFEQRVDARSANTLHWLRATENDLEAPALMVQPMVAQVLAALRSTSPQLARMTGSGACCFGLYADSVAAHKAAAFIAQANPEWWCVPTVISPR
ncbi:MAG: 4-(cytidine 5'-diphospho)-2-C-methyl-D-erythritol kinase [Rickettsiales bacterium]